MLWAAGVTTVPGRRNDLLPRTLASLRAGGFGEPRVFVDGWNAGDGSYAGLGLEVTSRWPRIGAYGNWELALRELFIRHPRADRYAIFQDDLVCVRNLRQYLERFPDPKGYWNLYTARSNESLAKGTGWFPSNQLGKGALGLVFSKSAAVTIFCHPYLAERPLAAHNADRSIDGAVVDSLSYRRPHGVKDWLEWCHYPSLLQHTGEGSTTIHGTVHAGRVAPSFPGEDWDAMKWLENR